MQDKDLMDKDSAKQITEMYDEQENPPLGFTKDLGCGHYMFFVRYNKDFDTVAHEIFHVAHMILSERGIELTGSGEAYAYLIGYITGHVYERDKKLKRHGEGDANKDNSGESKQN